MLRTTTKHLNCFMHGESYMLPELGSGIAQFFMVLANAAMRRPPFVLIDEPELNLHPSLPRDFLRCLVTEGVAFATHNLGRALAQADQVYSVQRIGHGRSGASLCGNPKAARIPGRVELCWLQGTGFR
jgi:ABC-type branched-subunit amino acid transport system ATPase component